jgi:hypothetical protein
VGAGAIGSHVLPHLARSPRVSRVTIVDRDTYELANLSGQDIDAHGIGRPKAVAQMRRLRRINPALELHAIYGAVEDLPLGALRGDVILGCLDSRFARMTLNQASRRLGMPFVDAGVEPTGMLARVACRGLVCNPSGAIEEAEEFGVGIWFPEDFVRRANPYEVLTWLGPRNVWHPNISDTLPLICVGRLVPGTSLVDLLYQVWEVITWNKATIREDDALNRAACQWARHNLARLPVDTRPLKRRRLDLLVEDGPSSEDASPSRDLDVEIHADSTSVAHDE